MDVVLGDGQIVAEDAPHVIVYHFCRHRRKCTQLHVQAAHFVSFRGEKVELIFMGNNF